MELYTVKTKSGCLKLKQENTLHPIPPGQRYNSTAMLSKQKALIVSLTCYYEGWSDCCLLEKGVINFKKKYIFMYKLLSGSRLCHVHQSCAKGFWFAKAHATRGNLQEGNPFSFKVFIECLFFWRSVPYPHSANDCLQVAWK